MKIHCFNGTLLTPRQRVVATIGSFDGVHLGHRHLIEQVVQAAHVRQQPSMVITFDRSPREVLTGQQSATLLTTVDEKVRLLQSLGVDSVAVLSFSKQLASLTAREFMQQVLVDELHVGTLLIGYDNRFGRNRTEGFAHYVAYGRELGIEVLQANELRVDGGAVGSSVVRQLLQEGRTGEAARLLGRPYELTGTVVHGFEQGRRIGFPTANLAVQPVTRLIPAGGVYGVECSELSPESCSLGYGMLNIGTRPTFDGHEQTIEVHIFNFSGNLYDHLLRVRFLHRLRGEHRFESPEALRQQLEHDKEELMKRTTPATPPPAPPKGGEATPPPAPPKGGETTQ